MATPIKRRPRSMNEDNEMTTNGGTAESPATRTGELTRLSAAEIAELVTRLEATGDHRVLRRLVPLPLHRCGKNDGLRCAIVADTETTGTMLPGTEPAGTAPSEIVALGMVAFAYDPVDGEIKGSIGRFHAYREPSHKIPPAATKIHGITDDDVRGRRIDQHEVATFIAMSAASVQDRVVFGSRDEDRLPLIIAHNAKFDRHVMEHHFPNVVTDLPWACSQTQVPWSEHGYEGVKLFYLGVHAGFFYGARHSALADADAVVELLRQKLGGRTAMARLREAARQDTTRIYVTTSYNADVIVHLKARGYRWSPGDQGRPRAWFWEGANGADVELAHLKEVGHKNIEPVRLDCFDRFSRRT